MHYGRMYPENDCYSAVASLLKEIGVRVPDIYGRDPERRLILMEDLGDTDLYALRGAPWEFRRPLYEKTLTLAARLHTYPQNQLPAGLRLMPGYNQELYQWEHRYFLNECVRNVCGVLLSSGEEGGLEVELSGLAGRLLGSPVTLIHRDLQSQNVMIRDGEPVLIDFQGLRPGSPFYDLGSVLYDPYVTFPDGGRDELLRFYYETARSGYTREAFRELFLLGSAQRLMQALGAYGFLGLKRAKPHFLAHIPRAVDNLVTLTAEAGSLPFLHTVASRCREAEAIL
jgi:N-acetylmuramate 1-kinase